MSGPRPNRRRVLVAGAALLAGGPAVLVGCTASAPPAPERPDPLEAPARRAEEDAALGLAVAQVHPSLAAAARAFAADRTAHSTTLRAELRRVRPRPAPGSPPSNSASQAAATPADPELTSARAALAQAVHEAQDEAAGLVITLPGFRAALLASVAACCATHGLPSHPDRETYRGDQTPHDRDMSPYGARSMVQVDALQAALGVEHAAVWAYGLAGAFLPEALDGQLGQAVAAHQARRDATERALIDAGAKPVQAEPGYLTPEPVTDAASALRLAITVETDAAAAWRSVVERSPADPGLRGAALDALTRAAVQATGWRVAAGTASPTVPFPGAP